MGHLDKKNFESFKPTSQLHDLLNELLLSSSGVPKSKLRSVKHVAFLGHLVSLSVVGLSLFWLSARGGGEQRGASINTSPLS